MSAGSASDPDDLDVRNQLSPQVSQNNYLDVRHSIRQAIEKGKWPVSKSATATPTLSREHSPSRPLTVTSTGHAPSFYIEDDNDDDDDDGEGSGTPTNIQVKDHLDRDTDEINAATGNFAALINDMLASHLGNENPCHDTFNFEDLRDGFFDATFTAPKPSVDLEILRQNLLFQQMEEEKPSQGFVIEHLLSTWQGFVKFCSITFHSRRGIVIAKAFISYFIMYILCLITATYNWFGRYAVFGCIAAILHHSGRSAGSEIEYVVLSIIGGALGLAWGTFGLYLSHVTYVATRSYGAVLACFEIVGIFILSWFRASYSRLYHPCLSAGIALIFMTTVDNSKAAPSWHKLWLFAIPYLFGLIISLVVCLVVFPDFLHRRAVSALDMAFIEAFDCFNFRHKDPKSHRQRIIHASVNLTEAYRDLSNEISFTVFSLGEYVMLRNTLQDVLRALQSLTNDQNDEFSRPLNFNEKENPNSDMSYEQLRQEMIPVSRTMTDAMASCLFCCYQVVMKMCHEEKRATEFASSKSQLSSQLASASTSSTSTASKVSTNSNYHPNFFRFETIHEARQELVSSIGAFDKSDESALFSESAQNYLGDEKIIRLLLFIQPLRLCAERILSFAEKIQELSNTRQGKKRIRWRRINLPRYPISKALQRLNVQSVHDRGGHIAGYYFYTNAQVHEIFERLKKINTSTVDRPVTQKVKGRDEFSQLSANEQSVRFKIWQGLHRMQDFESRFALKTVLSTLLLSMPAFLESGRVRWFFEYQAWWAAIFVYIIMHSRVGGNIEDLVTRSALVAIGSVWAGFALGARHGNRVVIGVFAAIFMIPGLYRFTTSAHPRSGLAGCFAFTVTSLAGLANYRDDKFTLMHSIIPKGLAVLIGLWASIIFNWTLWPFVARHELRKAFAHLFSHLSLSYRNVVARYLYSDQDDKPTALSTELSLIREARIYQNIMAMRDLLALTEHEPSLRGQINIQPYHLLMSLSEAFYQTLVDARVSTAFFRIYAYDGNEEITKALLSLRRDAVASIVLNFYALSNAFRLKRPIPLYMPSPGAARVRLLTRMSELEHEDELRRHASSRARHLQTLSSTTTTTQQQDMIDHRARRWATVYHYAFSRALTDLVIILEGIVDCSTLILGRSKHGIRYTE